MTKHEQSIRVKELGDLIGYGELMHLASQAWYDHMKAKNLPVSGVFIPVCPFMVKPDEIPRLEKTLGRKL